MQRPQGAARALCGLRVSVRDLLIQSGEPYLVAHPQLNPPPGTMERDMDDPRYPVGRYTAPDEVSPEQRNEWIGQIAEAPAKLREAVRGLGEEQLDTPYREG